MHCTFSTLTLLLWTFSLGMTQYAQAVGGDPAGTPTGTPATPVPPPPPVPGVADPKDTKEAPAEAPAEDPSKTSETAATSGKSAEPPSKPQYVPTVNRDFQTPTADAMNCSISQRIDGTYGSACQTGSSVSQMAQMSMMMTEGLGTGVSQSFSGVSGSSTTADMLDQSAQHTKDAAYTSFGIGGINAAIGLAAAYYSNKERRNASNLRAAAAAEATQTKKCESGSCDDASNTIPEEEHSGWVTSGNEIQTKIITEYNLNTEGGVTNFTAVNNSEKNQAAKETAIENRQKDESTQLSRVKDHAASIGTKAAEEQSGASSQTGLSAFMALAISGQEMASGGTSLATANALEAQAAQLRAEQNASTNGTLVAPPGVSNATTPQTLAAPAMITSSAGTSSGANSLASSTPSPLPSSPTIGGFNPSTTPTSVASNPTPGQFSANNGQGNSGGGGGGNVDTGGSTEAANPQGEDPGAKAPSSVEGTNYQSSGGSFMASGSSGGGNKGGQDGPDLGNLLDKFLPQAKSTDTPPSSSILSFASPNTAPSSGPILGNQNNIFTEISNTYQNAQKQGNL